MRRLLIFTFLILVTTTFSQGAIRAQQIQQIPSEPQQTLIALTGDSSGNLLATGNNPEGALVLKLDNSGNLIFTRSEIGSYPFGVAADTNGDVYWIGAAGTPLFPFPFTNSVLGTPPSGSLPGFVVKLRGTDGSIMWATATGAMTPDTLAIAYDGSVVVTGVANSTSGLTSPGAWAASTAAPAMPVEIRQIVAQRRPDLRCNVRRQHYGWTRSDTSLRDALIPESRVSTNSGCSGAHRFPKPYLDYGVHQHHRSSAHIHRDQDNVRLRQRLVRCLACGVQRRRLSAALWQLLANQLDGTAYRRQHQRRRNGRIRTHLARRKHHREPCGQWRSSERLCFCHAI
jgi:hypothetical protein